VALGGTQALSFKGKTELSDFSSKAADFDFQLSSRHAIMTALDNSSPFRHNLSRNSSSAN
jgi:hypothetical protein